MEQVHDMLSDRLAQHCGSVDWKGECEDEGWSPEYLNKVDLYAPICYYSFDVATHLKRIQWVKNDSGRQLLTGSFHPVNDKNWYENVKLEPGTHTFYRVVIDGFDYEDDASSDSMGASSKTVRDAIVEIFSEKDTNQGNFFVLCSVCFLYLLLMNLYSFNRNS